jgi:hypothetical protein
MLFFKKTPQNSILFDNLIGITEFFYFWYVLKDFAVNTAYCRLVDKIIGRFIAKTTTPVKDI